MDDTKKKMALNGYSVHFVGYGITENVRRLWMNFISCVMVVRNPMRVNNNTIIKRDNTEHLYYQTNSHGLRRSVILLYNYQFSFVFVIVYTRKDIYSMINLITNFILCDHRLTCIITALRDFAE